MKKVKWESCKNTNFRENLLRFIADNQDKYYWGILWPEKIKQERAHVHWEQEDRQNNSQIDSYIR